MMNNKTSLTSSLKVALGSAVMLAAVATPATAVDFEYSGYLRAHYSMNLSNNTSYRNGITEESIGGEGELSMARYSGKLEASFNFGKFQISSVMRATEDHVTGYERDLERATFNNPVAVTNHVISATHPLTAFGGFGNTALDFAFNNPPPPGVALPIGLASTPGVGLCQPGTIPGLVPQTVQCSTTPFTGFNGSTFQAGAQNRFTPDYDENDFHDIMRELYVTFDVGDRTHFKLGKQQVVWGETDFFRAMDIIHGYDLSWRSFLETENEELRKPLIMANVEIDIPEWGGSLQLVYRPGWDEGDDIGNRGALEGGRWAPQPWGGAGVTQSIIGPYNYHHSDADVRDANYGFRWSGVWNQIGYSLAYWRGADTDGLVNRNPVVGGSNNFSDYESGANLTELLFPKIETFGLSLNAYIESLDIVARSEMAFTPNKPYNTGTNTFVDLMAFGLGCDDGNPATCGFGAAPQFTALSVLRNDPENLANTLYDPTDLATSNAGLTLKVAGLGPVVEKDTLRIMLGFDKNLNLMSLLGTQRPSFWTVQLFDTWIVNFDKDDDIVDLFGFSAPKREHSTILTNAIVLNYAYDTINPGLAMGVDLGNFDMFFIPSVDFVFGDHWRLKLEADIFLPRHSKTSNLGFDENDTRLLGTLDNRDQLVARITYQF
ncbi:MAG: hypothetical protein KUG81_08045 [Gammaproteobacteria bacterium]|nr:hypothetical protein [Gammaproteobacteria bacterium]